MSVFEGSGTGLSIVYLLTNPAMPGLVKIGRTSQDHARLRLDQLYSTGVPVPFELVFACRVPNSVEVEQALHRAFAPQRVNPRREFFRIEPDQALAILRLLHVEEATGLVEAQPSSLQPEEVAATEELKRRRPSLNFNEMGIPLGALLHSVETDAVVEVVGPRKVRLGEEVTSLTSATRQVLGLEYAVAPGPHWTYEGRMVRAIYDETYS